MAPNLNNNIVNQPLLVRKGIFIDNVQENQMLTIDHFTVVGLVTWPLNGSEAGGDLVLIQTSLLLLCKSSCSYAT